MCVGTMTKTTENRNKNITNYHQVLGYEVLEWIDGHALLATPIQKKHRNRGRSIHGGVIASLVNVAGKMAGKLRYSFGLCKAIVVVTKIYVIG